MFKLVLEQDEDQTAQDLRKVIQLADQCIGGVQDVFRDTIYSDDFLEQVDCSPCPYDDDSAIGNVLARAIEKRLPLHPFICTSTAPLHLCFLCTPSFVLALHPFICTNTAPLHLCFLCTPSFGLYMSKGRL
jgi:hypothetical protein